MVAPGTPSKRPVPVPPMVLNPEGGGLELTEGSTQHAEDARAERPPTDPSDVRVECAGPAFWLRERAEIKPYDSFSFRFKRRPEPATAV